MGPANESEELNKLHFDNDGNVYSRNRAARRNRPPTDNWYTKATHSIKKKRNKNVKTDQQRKREIAGARKARTQSSTQVAEG